jgi:predicted amidohydrolase
MRLCAVQLRPTAGDVESNIARHLRFIELATAQNADFVFFPELSLTGYEPKLAKKLAARPGDTRWDVFQSFSDSSGLTIGVGMPLAVDSGIQIGMIFFQPDQPRCTYSKQMVHADELPYFICGEEQLFIGAGRYKIAPAICFESLQPAHAQAAAAAGANIYLASVAKSGTGVAKANVHYPTIAKQHSLTVLMSNCLGRCDDFVSAGQSAVWNSQGERVASLDGDREGIVVFDTRTQSSETYARELT